VTFDTIDYRVTEGRAEVFIDRPEKMNAFDEATLLELNEDCNAP